MLYELDNQALENPRHEPCTVSGTLGETTDEDLMAKLQRGDERALEQLIKRYGAMLRNIVGNMISNDQDVTDVVEEVFLGVWNHCANFDTSKGKVIGWVITMARRRAIDRIRRRQAYNRAEMRFRVSSDTGTSHFAGDDVEEQAAKDDNRIKFAEMISRLPEAQQAVVRMAFYDGLSQREIARKTGIPLGTIKTRLELGVKKLRVAVCAIGSRDEWLAAAA